MFIVCAMMKEFYESEGLDIERRDAGWPNRREALEAELLVMKGYLDCAEEFRTRDEMSQHFSNDLQYVRGLQEDIAQIEAELKCMDKTFLPDRAATN